MEWKEIKNGMPTAHWVLFAGKTQLSSGGLGWGYQIGIFNKFINKYSNRGFVIPISTTGDYHDGYTHYLVPEPPKKS